MNGVDIFPKKATGSEPTGTKPGIFVKERCRHVVCPVELDQITVLKVVRRIAVDVVLIVLERDDEVSVRRIDAYGVDILARITKSVRGSIEEHARLTGLTIPENYVFVSKVCRPRK